MSSVNATSAAASSAYADDPSSRVVKKSLGQEDFIKLLTVQMANQDPMNPVSDTDQIAQMAQFSSLQAITNVATELGYLRADSQLASASTLIGRDVTVTTKSGDISGTVQSVQADSNSVYVTVGGVQYSYGLISSVKAAATPSA